MKLRCTSNILELDWVEQIWKKSVWMRITRRVYRGRSFLTINTHIRTYKHTYTRTLTSSAVTFTTEILLLKLSKSKENWSGNSNNNFNEDLSWKSEENVIPDRTCRAYGCMGVKSNLAVRPSHEKWRTWQSLRVIKKKIIRKNEWMNKWISKR